MTSDRQRRKEIAEETVQILNHKKYIHPISKKEVSLGVSIERSCNETVVFDELAARLRVKSDARFKKKKKGCKSSTCPNISVVNQTTFAAAREIIYKQENQEETTAPSSSSSSFKGKTDVCCLNFASAKRPGGGFLKGSQAQEEALARASGLYSCLLKAPKFYNANGKDSKHGLYQDLVIYSPDVPIFRDDDDQLIENPWNTSIITAPAPNRGHVIKSMNGGEEEVEKIILDVFEKRIDMILSVAIKFGHRHLVLGAWGCGVFKNNPVTIADLFKSALLKKADSFDTVVFAVLDHSTECKTFNSFHEVFASFSTE